MAGFYIPPAAHGRPSCHGWWKFPRLPNICAWSLRPAQNICGLPPIIAVGRGGGTQHRPKLERWYVFRMGHVFQTSSIQDGVALPMYSTCRYSGAENHTPSHEIASKMRPLKHKFMVKRAKTSPLHRKQRRKCDPLTRKRRVGLSATRQPQAHLWVAWLHFLTQGLHFRPHFG